MYADAYPMATSAPIVIESEYLVSTAQAAPWLEQQETLPWLRLPDESSQAYAAFLTFRDLPRDKRSILAAYRLRKPAAKQPSRAFAAWATQYHWRPRADGYDAYLDTLRLRQREKEHLQDIEQYRLRLQQSSRAAFNAAIKALNKVTARLDKLEDMEIEPQNIPSYLRSIAAVLEAATSGESQSLAVDKLLILFAKQQAEGGFE